MVKRLVVAQVSVGSTPIYRPNLIYSYFALLAGKLATRDSKGIEAKDFDIDLSPCNFVRERSRYCRER